MTTRTARTVLIVEDDEDIAQALVRGLGREGYATTHASDKAAALQCLRAGRCDAAIVDMMLGEDSGLDVVAHLRETGFNAPILILSALSGIDDRARGLEAGANDYIVKPFEFAELVARLRVQERRAAQAPALPGYLGLRYDAARRMVTGGGRKIALTEREGDLLAYFIANPDRVITRGEIFDALWAAEGGTSENVVDVYIGYLRRKLAPMSNFAVALSTVRGRGFMLTGETI